ncbi:hypothetical protein BDV19DRAFT_72835 [Aspergillus venezuelensis]
MEKCFGDRLAWPKNAEEGSAPHTCNLRLGVNRLGELLPSSFQVESKPTVASILESTRGLVTSRGTFVFCVLVGAFWPPSQILVPNLPDAFVSVITDQRLKSCFVLAV